MSKESSIKVFAENASGTRPANAIPVWIDNISAISPGGGGGGNPEVESYVTDNSAKIDNVCTTYQTNSGSYLTSHQTILSAKWEDASDCVQTNSASWAEGGSSDTFYIYPGKTTDKEISENSGKDLKLYNSANNVFLDFAGKSTLSNYTMFSFKEITGTQYNQNTVQHLRLRVYPNATSACKVYDTNTVNLLDSNSTVSQANTAYYDAGGYSLTQSRMDFDALNSFVQSNSANWEGGSSPASDTVLYRFNSQMGSWGGWKQESSYVSGTSALYFEACTDSQAGTPNNLTLNKDGEYFAGVYWNSVSSDGSYNYYSASYEGLTDGLYTLDNNGWEYYTYCYVYANGVRTNAFNQGDYVCSGDKTVIFNIQGYNVTGNIEGMLPANGNAITQLTSFTGSLTDFTAKGYDDYRFNISLENPSQDGSYDLIAEFGAGGSSVASGDVFPSTNNLDPYATYYLGWNANNGGLFWYQPGNGGN